MARTTFRQVKPTDPVIVVMGISGLLQPRRVSNGVRKLVERLAKRFTGPPTLLTIMARWWERGMTYDDYARKLVGQFTRDNPPVIYLIGHSFGGHACVQVAIALNCMGFMVEGMFLADAVHQIDSEGGSGSLIEVSTNVKKVWIYRQKGIISGSKIKIKSHSDTEVMADVTLDVGHAEVDDLQIFQAAAFQEIMRHAA